ncbi:MAG TPA: L,D-transpeptidase [Bauldia sp.]|nr:L,D-transpeptidase [Bauldia sp.]
MRRFVSGGLALKALPFLAALCLAGCMTQGGADLTAPEARTIDPAVAAMYAEEADGDFIVPAVDLRVVGAEYVRQEVALPANISAQPGTIVVDPDNRFLYLVRENGTALRYGIGVGREGFAWHGTATVKRKQEWPTWTPPAEMVARDPRAAPFADGQPGGIDNPLGARALYLYQGDKDTLYRIHGTNEPASIGKAVSSGCIRMLNQDVIDLYARVPEGTKVIVLPSSGAQVAATI